MKKKIRKLVLAAAFCGFLAFFLPIAGAALSRKPSLDSETHSINTGQINRPESSMSISESPSGPDIEAEEVDLDRIESVSETDTEKGTARPTKGSASPPGTHPAAGTAL